MTEEQSEEGKQSMVQAILDDIETYRNLDITKAMNNGLFTNEIFYPLRISKMMLFMLIELFGEDGRSRSRGIRGLVLESYLKKSGKSVENNNGKDNTDLKNTNKRIKELEITIKELLKLFYAIGIIIGENSESLDYDKFADMIGKVDTALIDSKVTDLIGDENKIEQYKEKIRKELLS